MPTSPEVLIAIAIADMKMAQANARFWQNHADCHPMFRKGFFDYLRRKGWDEARIEKALMDAVARDPRLRP